MEKYFLKDTMQVQLASGTYKKEKFIELLNINNHISVVKRVKLYFNQCPTIIKEIVDINFGMPNLLILNLAYNKIDTLESLQKMSFISLRELHLFHNYITSLRSLRKCSMPQLTMASFVSNVLLDLKGIEEWNCPKLQQFFAYNNQIEFGFLSIIKLNCPNLTSIIPPDHFIHDDQLIQYLYFLKFPKFTP